MKKLFFPIIFLILQCNMNAQITNHSLNVTISVGEHELSVSDKITFPAEYRKAHKELVFTLNAKLEVKCMNRNSKMEELSPVKNNKSGVPLRTYKVTILNSDKDLRLSYSGKIHEEVASGAAEYARGFSETNGIIFEEGVYLAGSTHWIPEFKEVDLFTFNLYTSIDKGWKVVSQGERRNSREDGAKQKDHYLSAHPMDEIYLVAGKWTEYSKPYTRVKFLAFLRTPDEELANKYLRVTQSYLSMYEKMIGPYPYSKFALVENFWETGYGMPSFTLLGPKVIRFPWILHSSYPHELLHNYWGNSVYVDYEKGNWCEGITAYMADHLIKEQQGQGAEYRRSTLQKFTDFVNVENDFPLTKFLSRNNPAEEAIGYGKNLMMNNMLREKVGDRPFLKAYAKLYEDYKFKKASYDDIRACFEAFTKEDLKPFFKQWTERTGAPALQLSDVKLVKAKNYRLNFKLSQIQKEAPFDIAVPVYLYFENDENVQKILVQSNQKEQAFEYKYEKRPVKIEVDPTFQLFRRLDRKETPTTLTQVFGSEGAVLVLPGGSTHLGEYRKMAETWKGSQEAQGKALGIVIDSTLEKLPVDKAVWVLGFENKFATVAIPDSNYLNTFSKKDSLLVEKLKSEGSLVFTILNPGNELQTLGFVASKQEKAIAGLGRKLPHYGKYSYLGFEGEAPDNVLKGVFPALGSPLNYAIPYQGETLSAVGKIMPRISLDKKEEKARKKLTPEELRKKEEAFKRKKEELLKQKQKNK